MGSGFDFSNVDHTIFDQQGIRVIDKEGKEHQITEEEWKKAHPEHRTTDCKECRFVEDVSQLFTFLVPREIKERATEEPKDCGLFTMNGWRGHSHFYLFKCAGCGNVTVDYPHGYHGPYWYLRCGNCDCTLDLSSSKYQSIYEENNGFVPKFLGGVAGWLNRKLNRMNARAKSLES